VEHVAQQRECRRRDGRAGKPQQGTGGDQHLGTIGKSGEQRRQSEQCCADQHDLAAADAIAESAHGEQRASDQEAVNVNDPEQLRARGR
jgi:hypothetical protein